VDDVTDVDAGRYLRRIGLDVQVGPPTVELLAALQAAHLVTVPFENLHVFHRRGPRTDIGWSYAKVVEQRRGGWCFELNGAFGALLARLGFAVDHVSCQVWDPPPLGWGPAFDHLACVVSLDGERWFVDVGFGDNCLVPLSMRPGEVDAVPRRARIDVVAGPGGEEFVLFELMPHDGRPAEWVPQLRWSAQPRRLADFTPRSHHLQTDPDSTWWKKPFATRALDTAGSRITLRSDVLRRRHPDGAVDEQPVAADEWSAVLLEHFGLVDDGPVAP
jgi:N-hydroxyarylamine O-acetyltransferase